MPRVKSGELSLTEIRNLARQHNKASTIKNIDKKNRGDLIKEIESMGYKIDHANKKIVKSGKEISVGNEGEVKKQKRTKRKELIRQGSAPVMIKKVPEGDKRKAKPPPIPPNRKGKKISPAKEKARENLKKGY